MEGHQFGSLLSDRATAAGPYLRLLLSQDRLESYRCHVGTIRIAAEVSAHLKHLRDRIAFTCVLQKLFVQDPVFE